MKILPREEAPLFPSGFHSVPQAPGRLFLGSRWLHSSAWSCSRVAWGECEGGQWKCRSEGAALQEFSFSKKRRPLLPGELHCLLAFPCHSCMELRPIHAYNTRMKPALCPVFSQVFPGSQTPSACCHCCLKLAFVVASRGPGCSIVPLVLFMAQSHNKSQSLPQIY